MDEVKERGTRTRAQSSGQRRTVTHDIAPGKTARPLLATRSKCIVFGIMGDTMFEVCMTDCGKIRVDDQCNDWSSIFNSPLNIG